MARLYRDNYDKKIAGVCGGLAQYFRFDSSIIRLVFIFLTLLSAGVFLIFYILLWALLPTGPRVYVEAQYKKLYRSRRHRRISGVCGGLGTYFRCDANIIRLILIVLMFATGFLPILIFYVIAASIIPEEIQ